MAKIAKNMTIEEVINMDQGLITVLVGSGMHCIGCPSARGESLEDACAVHGIDADDLVQKLNDFLDDNANQA